MIQFFLTLRRLVRGITGAWRRDPQFRSLTFLVVFIVAMLMIKGLGAQLMAPAPAPGKRVS